MLQKESKILSEQISNRRGRASEMITEKLAEVMQDH